MFHTAHDTVSSMAIIYCWQSHTVSVKILNQRCGFIIAHCESHGQISSVQKHKLLIAWDERRPSFFSHFMRNEGLGNIMTTEKMEVLETGVDTVRKYQMDRWSGIQDTHWLNLSKTQKRIIVNEHVCLFLSVTHDDDGGLMHKIISQSI